MLSQAYERGLGDRKRVSKFEHGDKPDEPQRQTRREKLKDNADKDSDWPKLILEGSHC